MTNGSHGPLRRMSGVSFVLILIAGLLSICTVLSASPASASTSGTGFVPVAYGRVYDTAWAGETPFAALETRNIQVLGSLGVPSTGVTSVVLDVAVPSTTASLSTVQVYTPGTTRPGPPVVRTSAGATPVSSTVVVEPNAAGEVAVYVTGGTTSLNIDVQGYFTASGGNRFVPARELLVSSASGIGFSGTLSDGDTRTIQATGGAVPAGATAVFANVLAANPSGEGGFWLYPTGTTPATAKTTAFGGGTTDSSGIVVRLNSLGQFTIKAGMNTGTTGVRLEVTGYFVPSSSTEGTFTAIQQATIVNSGSGGALALPANGSIDLQVGGTNGIPTYGAGGVVLSLVVKDNASTSGSLRVAGYGRDQPAFQTLSFSGSEGTIGMTVTTVVQPGFDGKITLWNASTSPVEYRVSVSGWFSGIRQVAAVDEASFLSQTAALGAPAMVGQLAVWDAELIDSLPVTRTISLVPGDLDPSEIPTDDDPEVATAPTPPAGAEQVSRDFESEPAADPASYKGAGNGVCAANYKLYQDSGTMTYQNYLGNTIWTVTLKKKWCANGPNKRIGSVWRKQAVFIRGSSTFQWSDGGNDASNSEGGYLRYAGAQYPRSGHYDIRVRKMVYKPFHLSIGAFTIYAYQGMTVTYFGGSLYSQNAVQVGGI